MRLPFAISIPHCSFSIPELCRPSIALTQREILESTDLGAREVFMPIPVRVALWARWSRLVVDLNRDPLQRDAKGVIPKVDYSGRKIYIEEDYPGDEEVESRLKKYYWPYHNRLKEAIQDPEVKVLFDCHSLSSIGPSGSPDPLKWRKDIVLGNNGNPKGDPDPSLGRSTCSAETLQMIKGEFNRAGFSVSLNHPYSGSFITTHYGHELVKGGKMAVQIEINQHLYLDNETLRFNRDKIADIAKSFHEVFRGIAGEI